MYGCKDPKSILIQNRKEKGHCFTRTTLSIIIIRLQCSRWIVGLSDLN